MFRVRKTLVTVNGMPLKRNQRMIVNFIMLYQVSRVPSISFKLNTAKDGVLQLFEGKEGKQERRILLDDSNEREAEGIINYHISFVQLLASLSEGAHLFAENIVQVSLFSRLY